MTQLGITQTLVIQRLTSVGAYLNEESAKDNTQDASQPLKREDDVLLPSKYLKKDLKRGDRVSVFVYRDSDDRLIATTNEPLIEVGKFAFLQVVETTKIGAFLNWGLEKDLFLPFEEQAHKVKPRETVFVYCYIDKSDRLCATMKIKNRFATDVALKENDKVKALIYATNPEIGAFVLVDGKYNGLIPRSEIKGALPIGEVLDARVSQIKSDGKLDLSLKGRAHESIGEDAEKIFRMLNSNKGFLRLNDKSDPKDIKQLFGMSKAQFKRALGNLYKKEMIEIKEDGIHAVQGGKHDRKKR